MNRRSFLQMSAAVILTPGLLMKVKPIQIPYISLPGEEEHWKMVLHDVMPTRVSDIREGVLRIMESYWYRTTGNDGVVRVFLGKEIDCMLRADQREAEKMMQRIEVVAHELSY